MKYIFRILTEAKYIKKKSKKETVAILKHTNCSYISAFSNCLKGKETILKEHYLKASRKTDALKDPMRKLKRIEHNQPFTFVFNGSIYKSSQGNYYHDCKKIDNEEYIEASKAAYDQYVLAENQNKKQTKPTGRVVDIGLIGNQHIPAKKERS